MANDKAYFDSRPVLVIEDSDEDFETVVSAADRAHISNRLVRACDADAARRLLAEGPDAALTGNGVAGAAGAFVWQTQRDAGHDARAGNFYAFMLIDDKLPGQDGLELLKELRAAPLPTWLPAVVLTASIDAGNREAYYNAGADAYHVKLLDYAESLRTLEEIFSYWLNCTAPARCGPSAAAARWLQ